MKLQIAVLRRRGIFKTLAGYALVSWVLIEVTSVIAPAFLLPDWVVAALTTVLVLGAFPALLLSWRYEFTSEGIKLDTRTVPDEFDFSARSLMTLIIILLLAVTALLWVNYFRSQSISEVEELLEAQQGAPEIALDGRIRSIAVLPFDDFSPDGGKGLLADGISEAILHVLAQNRELVVTSRKSSFMFRDKDISAAEIGRILNVEALLEGSIQIVKDQLRVTSQLIRTSDQAHIWSNVYEAPLDDLFKVNDDIAKQIRNLILPEGRALSEQEGQPHPPSVAAFQLLLEARELIGDLESTDRAIRLIKVILDMWPDYAEAWGWLAMAYDTRASILSKSHTVTDSVISEVWEKSMEAAETAIELNPDNYLAILIIGRASADYSGKGYHDAVNKVWEAAPNDPDVLNWLASLSLYATNFASARETLARARAVDPSDDDILESYMWASCGGEPQTPMVETQLEDYPVSRVRSLYLRWFARYCDRQYIETANMAIQLARIDSDPQSVLHALILLADLGHQEALALIEAAHRLMPRLFDRDDEVLNLLYFTDILPERLDSYRRHMQSSFKSGSTPIMFAIAQMLAGDYENAEKNLDRVITFWDRFYDSEGGRFWQRTTITIYAYKAWLMAQRGESEEAGEIAAELLLAMEEKRNIEWSGSRGLFGDIPLMILVQNGRMQQATDWLMDAEQDHWLLFQAILTSPVYAGFRKEPAVADALSRMVDWRTGILQELIAEGLPEIEDPGLLLDLMQSLSTLSYYDRAQVALHFDDDPEAALHHYQQALLKDPANVAIGGELMYLALQYGLVDEAVYLAEHNVSLSPDDASVRSDLAFSYLCAQRYADAVTGFQRSLELDPENSYYQRMLSMALILNGEPDAAMQIVIKVSQEYHRRLGMILAYYALGQQARSDALMQEWLESNAGLTPFHFAYVAAFRGDIDVAFEWLKKAKATNQAALALVHPFLYKLHDDPRWLPFLRSIGKSPQQLEQFELVFDEKDE